jgi:hypothetical protein
MERHDADTQRLGDLALRLAGGSQHSGLLELGRDFGVRMSLGFHDGASPISTRASLWRARGFGPVVSPLRLLETTKA